MLKRTQGLKKAQSNPQRSEWKAKGAGKASISLSRASKPMKKGKRLSTRKPTQEELEIAQMTRNADRAFCQELWRDRQPYSEISGEWLGIDPNWACVHHIYAKARYMVYRYDPANCILLTIQEHAQVEQDMYRYPEVNKRRDMLKKRYNIH